MTLYDKLKTFTKEEMGNFLYRFVWGGEHPFEKEALRLYNDKQTSPIGSVLKLLDTEWDQDEFKFEFDRKIMTIEEIEQALGHKVKIVNKNQNFDEKNIENR